MNKVQISKHVEMLEEVEIQEKVLNNCVKITDKFYI